MVQWSLLPILSSTAVLAQSNTQTVTKVNFGNYNGTYEGDIEDMIPLSFGSLKQRSSQGAPQMTPDVRRYSHLKLMISYVMGSGAIAGKLLNCVGLVLTVYLSTVYILWMPLLTRSRCNKNKSKGCIT